MRSSKIFFHLFFVIASVSVIEVKPWELSGIFNYFSDKEEPKIIVNTTYGLIQGTSSSSRSERKIYEFLAIPYAKPPVDSLRFQAPVAPSKWEGIRDGTDTGAQCLQIHLVSRIIFGEEDCLHLNVFTHKYAESNTSILDSELKPVIFYIHGGFFMHGSGNYYKPKYFLDEDVVLVTVNYRVGALGFLNMGNDQISGNMGLKDQVLALKWVQDNIKQFGGNPGKVTLMGESAGAVCVHLHLLSPMSKGEFSKIISNRAESILFGLFHGAMSQSGTALNFWAIKDKPQEQGKRFAKIVGCDSDIPQETANCLRYQTGVNIVKGHRDAGHILTNSMAIFGPTVENGTKDDPNVFLYDTPRALIEAGKMANVPWMNGVNKEEGLIYAAPMLKNSTVRKEMNKNWSKWLPIIFNFDDEPEKELIANKIREYYLGDVTTEISMDNLENFTRFLSDRTFFQGMHNTALLHGKHSESPLYLFVYSYEGKFSFAKVAFQMSYAVPAIADIAVSSGWGWIKTNIFRMKQKSYGVCHGDELPLLFNLPLQPIRKAKSAFSKDFQMSEYLVKLFASFATDGKPFETSWLPFNRGNTTEQDESTIQVMKLDRLTQEMMEEPFTSRANFWETLNLRPMKVQDVNCTEFQFYIQCWSDSGNILNAPVDI